MLDAISVARKGRAVGIGQSAPHNITHSKSSGPSRANCHAIRIHNGLSPHDHCAAVIAIGHATASLVIQAKPRPPSSVSTRTG